MQDNVTSLEPSAIEKEISALLWARWELEKARELQQGMVSTPQPLIELFKHCGRVNDTAMIENLMLYKEVRAVSKMAIKAGIKAACEQGHTDILNLLLPYWMTHVGKSPNTDLGLFNMVCEKGYSKEVERQFANIEDMNALLHHACAQGYEAIVRLLLADPRVDVNKGDGDKGNTPFVHACYHGHEAVVRLLLADPRVDVNKPSLDGNTPFAQACAKEKIGVVRLLLADQRVDVNKVNNWGSAPFVYAGFDGSEELVRLLLANPRVDVNQKNGIGSTPFLQACISKREAIVSLLLADPRVDVNQGHIFWAPFYQACFDGSEAIVRLLLTDPRIDFNKVSSKGNTPFAGACYNGNEAIVRLLLADPRIDVNQSNTKGKSPLVQACIRGSADVLALLLQALGTHMRGAVEVQLQPLFTQYFDFNFSQDDDNLGFPAACCMDKMLAYCMLAYMSKGIAIKDTFFANLPTKDLPGVALSESQLGCFNNVKALLKAAKTGNKEVLGVIGGLSSNPLTYWHKLEGENAVALFAQVIFLGDGYLKSNPGNDPNQQRAAQFFNIVTRLPMELQMVVCHRVFSSTRDPILSTESEPAFKMLANKLALEKAVRGR